VTSASSDLHIFCAAPPYSGFPSFIKRDTASLYIIWIEGDSLEGAANFPART
jgi:hypothetical protein